MLNSCTQFNIKLFSPVNFNEILSKNDALTKKDAWCLLNYLRCNLLN